MAKNKFKEIFKQYKTTEKETKKMYESIIRMIEATIGLHDKIRKLKNGENHVK